MRKIIINADDFGWDADTFETTVSCFEAGMLSSATIMTGMPFSKKAYQFAKYYQSQFSFGLHFNIVDGHRALSTQCLSLCNRYNRFYPSRKQRLRAIANLSNPQDIRRELRLQIIELLDNGVSISHIDSHGHLHKFPCIINAMKSELERFKIKKIRRPQNVFLKQSMRRKITNTFFEKSFKNISYTDNFLAIEPELSNWPTFLSNSIKDGITEIAVHPGRRESWRLSEAAPLLDTTDLRTIFKNEKFHLINYNHQ